MQLFWRVNRLVSMELAKIGMLIYVVRGQRVMVDWDLAVLYGVENRSLNQAVKRHQDRFPEDFMFKLTPAEASVLRSQIVIANIAFSKQRFLPNVFTEQGVSMLSSVLRSKRAIRVNMEIMRAFVRMGKVLALNKDLAERIEKAESRLKMHDEALGEHAGAIREVFEDIRRLMELPEGPKRKIGF